MKNSTNSKNRLRLSQKSSKVYVSVHPEHSKNDYFKAVNQKEVSQSSTSALVPPNNSSSLLFSMYDGSKQKTDAVKSSVVPEGKTEKSYPNKVCAFDDLTNINPNSPPSHVDILKPENERSPKFTKLSRISEIFDPQTNVKVVDLSSPMLSESVNNESANVKDTYVIPETPVKKMCIDKPSSLQSASITISKELKADLTSPSEVNSSNLNNDSSPIFGKGTSIKNGICFQADVTAKIPPKLCARSFLSSSSELKNTVENKANRKFELKNKLSKAKLQKKVSKNVNSVAVKNEVTEYTVLKSTESANKPVTPVKNYPSLSGTSVKRLSTSGNSPLSKRNINRELIKTDNLDIGHNNSNDNNGSNLYNENHVNNCDNISTDSFETYTDEDLGIWETLEYDPEDVWDRNVPEKYVPEVQEICENNDSLENPTQSLSKSFQNSETLNVLQNPNVKNNSISNFTEKTNKEVNNKTFDWFRKKKNMIPKKSNDTDDNFLTEILLEIPVTKCKKLIKERHNLTKEKNCVAKIQENESSSENRFVVNDKEILTEILQDINSSAKGSSNHVENNLIGHSKDYQTNISDIHQSSDATGCVHGSNETSDIALMDLGLNQTKDTSKLAFPSTSCSPVTEGNHILPGANSSILAAAGAESNIKENDISMDNSLWDSSFDLDEEQKPSTPTEELCGDISKLSPFKQINKPHNDLPLPSTPVCSQYNRYQVTEVKQEEQDIVLLLAHKSQTVSCRLHGFWCYSFITVGDIVHILEASVDAAGVYHITDEKGLLVINPDFLLSSTSVVSSLFCMRKAVLNERFKGLDKGNLYMLYGSIVHCLLQEVLKHKIFAEKEIVLLIKSIMKRKYLLHEIYGQGTDESVVLEAVSKYIPSIITWVQRHTDFMKYQSVTRDNATTVTSICDIEENIWSPRFGLKGKIDLSVEVKTHNLKKKVVPLELKTGRASFSSEHKGQVTMYTMMMSDRREDPKEGLLLYLKDQPNMSVVTAQHQDKRGLIQLRNEIVHYIQNSIVKQEPLPEDLFQLIGKLPEPINNVSACTKCPHLLSCSIYQNLSLTLGNMSNSRKDLHQTTLAHLSQSHLQFFIRWCAMIEFEKQKCLHGEGFRDIWCSTGSEREKKGECISNLQFCGSEKLADTEKVLNLFKRHSSSKSLENLVTINAVGLNIHDSVAISIEDKQQLVMCRGYIYHITEESVVVMCDRSFDDCHNVEMEIFKVDKCSDWDNWGICYNNLVSLMANTTRSARLRQLIIDHEAPKVQQTLAKSAVQNVKSIFKPLNKLQKVALLKVFMNEDYVVIRGYPGTGKTSTIVALIQVLVTSGLKVLVASFTHSAVDNILLKLKKENVLFLRLGRKDRIHPEIYPYSAEELTKTVQSVQELKAVYESMNIVATTCVGMSHTMFSQCHRQFDVCIIDESSQVMLPMCLGPIFAASKFILVGDSKQLPPIIQSDEAKHLGMDRSLFAELEDRGTTVQLNLQYRMNREIMSLSNELIYEGCLQCGTEEVATRTLITTEQKPNLSPWMSDIISSELDKAVLFLNTKLVPAPETYNTKGEVQNNIEAQLVATIVSLLQTAGVNLCDIGIIAPYRNQVRLVQQSLMNTISAEECVEVNTVDQYQGRDKDVIILTMVRSTDKETLKSSRAGGILKDIRRLNVAMTRAKCGSLVPDLYEESLNLVVIWICIEDFNILDPGSLCKMDLQGCGTCYLVNNSSLKSYTIETE
ncbi:DNA replication ATP-dependent helicase/nuclease DNA2-like [Argonauta hians]